MSSKVQLVGGFKMKKLKVGAAILSLLFVLGTVASSSPQDDLRIPSVSKSIDGATKSIRGYKSGQQAGITTDGKFLRRLMLDLVGYPPNLDQVKAFIADTNEKKRAIIINQLLLSEDFNDLWARKFANVFFGNYHNVPMGSSPALSDTARTRIVNDFIWWLKRKFRQDRGWNEIVFEMLDARGTDEGDPALAYLLSFYRGEGKAIEFARGAAEHLLGIRLLCARCHDHPFDQWRVEDYYGLAAFVVRQSARGYGGTDHVRLTYAMSGEMMIQRSPDANDKKTKVRLAQGGSAPPKFLFGGMAGKNDDRARVLAKFMTMKANTQLPRALANRVWGWLFGQGLVHPVDDFNMRNRALSKSLLEAMTRDMMAHGYSLKRLLRGICNSQAYQRATKSEHDAYKITFSRYPVTALSGEQLINSISVATTGGPKKNHANTMSMVASLYPASAIWCEVTPLPSNARQALLLRNSSIVSSGIRSGIVSRIQSMSGSVEQKVVEMFLAALSRKPNEKELGRYVAFIKANSGNGYSDGYWTLMNSTEFVTKN